MLCSRVFVFVCDHVRGVFRGARGVADVRCGAPERPQQIPVAFSGRPSSANGAADDLLLCKRVLL